MMFIPNVLKNSDYRKLYLAAFLSELGSFISETAITIYLYELASENKSYLGLSKAMFLIFMTLGNILGGPIGEKKNKRNVLLCCELFRIPIICSIFFVQNVWSLIILHSGVAFFTGIFNPTRQASVNLMVPKNEISDANSLFGTTFAIIHFIGPIVGASAYAFFKGIHEVLILDIATYCIGIFLLKRILNFDQKYSVSEKILSKDINFFSDIKQGLQYVSRRVDLMALLTNNLIAGFVVGILLPLLLPFSIEVLGKGKVEYGMLITIFGLGGFVGSLLTKQINGHFRYGQIIVMTACIEAVTMLIWVNLPNYYGSLILLFIWGMNVLIRIPTDLNYISNSVEKQYLSRVHSLFDLTFVAPNITGGILVGIIGNRLPTYTILMAAAILFCLLMIGRLPFKQMKTLYSSEI